VSERIEETADSIPKAVLAGGFEDARYVISTKHDEFNIGAFTAYFKPKVAREGNYTFDVAPVKGADGDYHIHVNWTFRDDDVNFTIDYFTGGLPHAPDERAPFAEEFMDWLGQFFKAGVARAHLHARFKYSLASRQSKYSLPAKTTLPYNAELYGVSMVLTDEPNGVSSVRIDRGKTKYWYAEVVANRTVKFGGYSITDDIAPLHAVLSVFLEEVRPNEQSDHL
jgi:hypothetical protein